MMSIAYTHTSVVLDVQIYELMILAHAFLDNADGDKQNLFIKRL
jgi:hypothetical protein